MFFELRRKALHALFAVSFFAFAPHLGFEVLNITAVTLFAVFAGARLIGVSARFAGVSRTTYGELFFALGVLGSALLSYPDMALFQIAMIILAVADPLAALVGTAFGRHTYRVFDEKRSIEGSAACFVSAVSVLVLCSVPALASVGIAIVLTVVEAFSLRGSDNLFIPLVTIVMMQFLL